MKQAFGALFLGVLAVMLWVYWPRTDIFSGILEATGRVEGDQTAVGAKMCRGIGCLTLSLGYRFDYRRRHWSIVNSCTACKVMNVADRMKVFRELAKSHVGFLQK